MKTISKFALISSLLLLSSTQVNSSPIQALKYKMSINEINKIQSQLVKCTSKIVTDEYPHKSTDAVKTCYEVASEDFNSIAMEIRNKNKDKADKNTWQTIYLGYANQIKDCTNPLLYVIDVSSEDHYYSYRYKTHSVRFLPFLNCEATANRSFALASANVHLAN